MKRYDVVVTASADDDYCDISNHLLDLVTDLVAIDTLEQLEAAIASLAELPDRGRPVYELRRDPVHVYRELIRLRYRIIYRVEGGAVIVVAIVDHRRGLEALLQQRARRDLAR